MSVVVWILAILLALAFLASGLMKIVVGKKLEERIAESEISLARMAEDMREVRSSVLTLFERLGPEQLPFYIGLMIIGAIADWGGLRAPVAGGAALCLIALFCAFLRRRQLARVLEVES